MKEFGARSRAEGVEPLPKLLIDCQEGRTLGAVLVVMLWEARPKSPRTDGDCVSHVGPN